MKNTFFLTILGIVGDAKRISSLLLMVLLCSLIFLLGGCNLLEQPGETTAKGHRRHQRNMILNQQNLMSDLDRVLLIDKPSRLTDKKIPPDISN